jgi:putative Mg2+ transporter-C (MgtC) family protein
VRRDAVRGLTTAAGVWLVAAVGMACGASLPLLAVALTGGHLIVSFGSRPIIRRLPRSRPGAWMVRLSFRDGQGVLRQALEVATREGFVVTNLTVDRPVESAGIVSVSLEVEGGPDVGRLAAAIGEVNGVVQVATEGIDDNG